MANMQQITSNQEDLDNTEEQEDTLNYTEIAQNLINNNMLIYSYNNILNIYENLTENQVGNLLWLFQRYYGIYIEPAPDGLRSQVYNSMNAITSNVPNKSEIKQHKIFKNILFNCKELSFLSETGEFKIFTYQDMLNFYKKENLFTIAKIDMGSKLVNSLQTLGFNIANSTTGIANHQHETGFKYVILTTEPIGTEEYLNILTQNRNDELWYENKFDQIGSTAEFAQETEMTFTYMKSNYINQSRSGNMSLKAINKELSSTETTTDVSVAPAGVSTGASVSNQSGY